MQTDEHEEHWTDEEKATENIYEIISCREGMVAPDLNKECLKEVTKKREAHKKEKTEDNKKQLEDLNQKTLHNQMIEELHAQFLVMAEQHGFNSTWKALNLGSG